MVRKLLTDKHKVFEEKGALNTKRGAKTDTVQKIIRDYLDSLMSRVINSVKASTESRYFGESSAALAMMGGIIIT
ncbi:hypothetical protein ACJDU8_20095 [Clostridium sp. WILCCON 0269]|uniref:Uncharacterized protein n=1 Tax=Candidatus Clostridium eludens TaxID=3381663 RepID=A0ABW8SPK7_9CLOT